jgi:hypothetical protein
MFEKDCFHVYQPDATFAGGIAQVQKVMEMCRQKERLFTQEENKWQKNAVSSRISGSLFSSSF